MDILNKKEVLKENTPYILYSVLLNFINRLLRNVSSEAIAKFRFVYFTFGHTKNVQLVCNFAHS